LTDLGVKPEEVGEYNIMRGEGCSACNNTGVKGRIAIYELMTMTDSLRDMIMKGGTSLELKQAALKGGMRSLRQAALMKLKNGQISIEQVVFSTVKDSKA